MTSTHVVPTIASDLDQREVSSFWVKGIFAALAAEGFDVNGLLGEVDLNPSALADPDARFPSRMVNHLWKLAVARSGDDGVGLKGAAAPRPGIFDVVGYAMMSASNLRHVLDRAIRYMRIASDAVTLTSYEGDDGYRLSLQIGDDNSGTPWQRYAFDLLSLLSFLRWVLGRDLQPLVLKLQSLDSKGLDRCREFFGCPVQLQATTNCLLFSYEDMDLILPTAHPHLASVHERIADEYIARLSYLEVSARARNVILKSLPDGEPRRETVARTLGMSERTLQRRLKDEGCSFNRLLDDTRKELAGKYIAQDDMALAEAAYLLGFEDQSSFFRAAKRWFGSTPRVYRLQLAGKSTDTNI